VIVAFTFSKKRENMMYLPTERCERVQVFHLHMHLLEAATVVIRHVKVHPRLMLELLEIVFTNTNLKKNLNNL
jgi:hypothetical protein